MKNKFTYMVIATMIIAAVPLFCSCLGEKHHDHDGHETEEMHAEDEHDHHHSPDDIILEPEKAQAAGVEVSKAELGTFHDVIKVSGSIVAASCDETTIVATVSGVVDHARHISEGMAISKGTTVYYIKSDKLQDGDNAQRIRINYLAAQREYERALPLVKDKIISEKDFNVIKTEYETARLAYEAVGKGVSAKGVAVNSPITGYMKECMVKEGDYVEVGTPLMVVTKNQHLYLRAEVPVRYYSSLSKISSAKFRTQYDENVIDLRDVNGTLLSSGKSAVSTSSYVPVTFQLDNKGNIVPGSYAEVFLITGERHDVMSLPTKALTEEQGIYYVYVREDEHSYHKQEVTLGATDGEFTEIKSGLKGGEMVVTKGAINVKLAAASNAIPAHTHNH